MPKPKTFEVTVVVETDSDLTETEVARDVRHAVFHGTDYAIVDLTAFAYDDEEDL